MIIGYIAWWCRGNHGQTNQLHDIDWGTLDHISCASQFDMYMCQDINISFFCAPLVAYRCTVETATRREMPLTTLLVSSVPPAAPTTRSAVATRRYQWTPQSSMSSSSRGGGEGREGEGEERAGRREMELEGQPPLHQVSLLTYKWFSLSLSLSLQVFVC